MLNACNKSTNNKENKVDPNSRSVEQCIYLIRILPSILRSQDVHICKSANLIFCSFHFIVVVKLDRFPVVLNPHGPTHSG